MEKKYLVTGFWTDKKSGKPVSGIVEIAEGLNASGQPYQLATDGRESIDGSYPVGTILGGTLNLTIQEKPEKPTPELKIRPTA